MPPVIRSFDPANAQPVQPRRPSAEARAAQRAFFQQAVGDATPVRTAAAVSAPRAATPTPARGVVRAVPDQKPDRILRPGSFVDIVV